MGEILKIGLCILLAIAFLVGICSLLIFAPAITLLVCLGGLVAILIGSITMLFYALIFG